MTPGTGAPDYAASTTRIGSTRQQGTQMFARTSAAFLFMAMVLGGCASQQPASSTRSDTSPAGAVPGSAVPTAAVPDPGPPPKDETVRSGHASRTSGEWPPPPPVSADSAVVSMLDDDQPAMPPQPRAGDDAAGTRDTWARIRDGLSLPRPENKRVRREIGWYGKHPEYIRRMSRRARPYLTHIVREIERRGMPMELALVPFVESAFHAHARSPAGASGLWQFIPSTGRLYGLRQSWWYDGRRDVVASTRAALDYLTKLLREFDDDLLLAVAAYNWGEGNVRRAISRNRARGKPTDVWSLRLPRETRAHVSRLLAIAAIVENPDRYGVVLEPIPDRIHFREVPLEGQIRLSVAANLAGIPLEELRRLNPGFKRSATDPEGPHRLQLPADAADRFEAGLASLSAERGTHWARYTVVRGDTLSAIAYRYRTSVAMLKSLNRLTSPDRILAGSHLMVPSAAGHSGESVHYVRSGDSLWGPASQPAEVYVVERGDTLSAIARRHGTTVLKLAQLNRIEESATLLPGQKLRLIPNAEVKNPGDRRNI